MGFSSLSANYLQLFFAYLRDKTKLVEGNVTTAFTIINALKENCR
jgi:hypothetical protein